MTDETAHRSGTATVALLAPAAAAVLAGSLAWTAAHPPPQTTSAAVATPSAGSPEQLRDIERLRQEVASLRAELQGPAALPAGTKPKARGGTPPPVHARTGAS